MQRTRRRITLTANKTLDRTDSGSLIVFNAVDLVATLPKIADAPTEDALFFDFVVLALSATTGAKITANAADKIDGGSGGGSKTNTAATDAVGDAIRLFSAKDGEWLAANIKGTWA